MSSGAYELNHECAFCDKTQVQIHCTLQNQRQKLSVAVREEKHSKY